MDTLLASLNFLDFGAVPDFAVVFVDFEVDVLTRVSLVIISCLETVYGKGLKISSFASSLGIGPCCRQRTAPFQIAMRQTENAPFEERGV
ncbi:hypothetical protein [Sulfitobacter noctilucae]|uniref:hypothetical protein n=1 Tax=Sulfitobacter noctilucae TaxID=1342302 RepID=UPI0012678C18|nr:hypothetical protein [Sulfitobacter noctilucae]